MLVISASHAKYLATTDFDLLLNCMESGLSPTQYRILHYISSCMAHDYENLNLGDLVEWLGMDSLALYGDLQYLKRSGIMRGFEIQHLEDDP